MSITIQVYLHSFSCFHSKICKIPQNSDRNQTYSRSMSSKVVDLGVNRKRMRLPLDISPTVFEILTFKARKLHTPTLFDARLEGTR